MKERTRNKLKDYLTMAPALQVTHLLAFTLTDISPSLRIVRLPGGPTLSFRVERYSLVKDVLNSSKRGRSVGLEYLSPPLLVLASFPPPSPTTPPHLPLVMKAFQSLFPPLSPGKISLSSARRVALVSYDPDKGTIEFRHYLITIKPYGVSKRIRKVLGGVDGTVTKSKTLSGILDLGSEKDVADFLLRRRGDPGPSAADGYESAVSEASSVAGDDAADAVSLASDYVGRNNKKGQKRAVKLDEIGPRMELRLIKITEGVPGKDGSVIYHELVKKSKKEVSSLKAVHAEKQRLRKERREEQERNVQRKTRLMEAGKQVEVEDDEDQDEDGNIDDEGVWDDEEEVSDGDDEMESDGSEDEPPQRPTKKVKLRSKR